MKIIRKRILLDQRKIYELRKSFVSTGLNIQSRDSSKLSRIREFRVSELEILKPEYLRNGRNLFLFLNLRKQRFKRQNINTPNAS